jgi:hypothetical protein
LDDVLHAIQKEHHAHQERQMVVAGDHMFGPEIHQRTDRRAVDALQKEGILARNAMRAEVNGSRGHRQQGQ